MIFAPERWHQLLTISPAFEDRPVTDSLADLTGGPILFAFSVGIIVPPDVLAQYDCAYNFHAGSSGFPGRDPHHWAVYEGAEWFGVTLHHMTAKVDDGPIVAGYPIRIGDMGAQELRRTAELYLVALWCEWAPRLLTWNPEPEYTPSTSWSGAPRRRADLLKLLDCRGLPPEEVARRQKAFEGFPLIAPA